MIWDPDTHFAENDIIDDAIDMGYLIAGSAAVGIARKVQAEGEASLSEKQRAIYEKQVRPALSQCASYIDRKRKNELVDAD